MSEYREMDIGGDALTPSSKVRVWEFESTVDLDFPPLVSVSLTNEEAKALAKLLVKAAKNKLEEIIDT